MKSKTFIFIALGLAWHLTMRSQAFDIKPYRQAFDYICADLASENLDIEVSDSLVHLYRPAFWRYFRTAAETDSVAQARVSDTHQQDRHKPLFVGELTELNEDRLTDSTSQKFIVFFSKIVFDNFLLGEVLPVVNGDTNYYHLSAGNREGFLYLFFLNDKQSIQKAVKRPLRYVRVGEDK